MPKHLKLKELLLVVMYVFFTVQATFLSYSQRFILSDMLFSVITSMFFSTFSRLLNPSWPLVVTLSRISHEMQEDQLVLTVLQIPQGNNFPVLLFSVSVLIPFYQVPVNNCSFSTSFVIAQLYVVSKEVLLLQSDTCNWLDFLVFLDEDKILILSLPHSSFLDLTLLGCTNFQQ